jgi:Flp pilus assembly pilin Flp
MRTESQLENSEPRGLIRRLLRDDRGQDLIEYGLLAFTIGLVGIAAWDAIVTGIGVGYGNWDTGTQNLWMPQDPAAGP